MQTGALLIEYLLLPKTLIFFPEFIVSLTGFVNQNRHVTALILLHA